MGGGPAAAVCITLRRCQLGAAVLPPAVCRHFHTCVLRPGADAYLLQLPAREAGGVAQAGAATRARQRAGVGASQADPAHVVLLVAAAAAAGAAAAGEAAVGRHWRVLGRPSRGRRALHAVCDGETQGHAGGWTLQQQPARRLLALLTACLTAHNHAPCPMQPPIALAPHLAFEASGARRGATASSASEARAPAEDQGTTCDDLHEQARRLHDHEQSRAGLLLAAAAAASWRCRQSAAASPVNARRARL